jgi:hypothetical protein
MAHMSRLGFVLAWGLCLTPLAAGAQSAPTAGAQPAPLERALNERIEADAEERTSQRRVDELDDATQKMLTEYRRALSDAESYEAYAEQLEAQVQSQSDEKATIEQQLLEIETTSREVLPLMQRMLDTLEQFVALDVPFLLEERTARVERLNMLMDRADVTISEKYRLILEAYQIELNYGSTFDAYEGRLGTGPDARTVEFARLGRVSLMYRTLDGSETGYWDAQKKDWVSDPSYRDAVEQAIDVAGGGTPDLLTVPVPPPQEVRS